MKNSKAARGDEGDRTKARRAGQNDDRDPIDNRAIALSWLAGLRRSERFAAIPEEVRGELEFTARALAVCSFAAFGTPALQRIKGDDAKELLLHRLPAKVSARSPRRVVDAAIELLLWAARAGHIAHDVEYACLRVRHQAYAAMLDERRWSPPKQILEGAMRDGIDPADVEGIRDHAHKNGMNASFVDEFLPPCPVSLGGGRWAWLLRRVEVDGEWAWHADLSEDTGES